MAAEYAKGIDAINKTSFGCSCHALGNLISTLQGFPRDVDKNASPGMKASHKAQLVQLAEDCKKWQQGPNYTAGSAVFCLLTKDQLDAKKVLEENGFEELGRTISSHIWPYDMNDFRKTLDASQVIYLMGKGWYHQKEK